MDQSNHKTIASIDYIDVCGNINDLVGWIQEGG